MDWDYIEKKISEIDELYYWAVSYCVENSCLVRQFYHDNKEEIHQIIKKHEALA